MAEKKHCQEFNGFIDLYIHNELDSYGKEKFDEHIAFCDDCRLLLDEETATALAVKKFGEETPDIASAVMKHIIEEKLTIDKPKRKFSFAPSLIPAAMAVIAVTLFSRTNIMKMLENNFDSAISANEAHGNYTYSGQAEIKKWSAFSDEAGEAEVYGDDANNETAAASAFDDNEALPVLENPTAKSVDADIGEDIAAPESRSLFVAPEEISANENEINIEDMTGEYNEEIFDEVKGQLNASGVDEEEDINTLIVLSHEDEALIEELLQDIEYENVNGIIMADISAFQRFIRNSNDNNYDDFRIYQENEKSNILAFTFENNNRQNQENLYDANSAPSN